MLQLAVSNVNLEQNMDFQVIIFQKVLLKLFFWNRIRQEDGEAKLNIMA